MTDETERFYTISEVARTFHVNEDTIRRWIKGGHIPYIPIGPFKLKRLRAEDLIRTQGDKNGQHKGDSGGTKNGKEIGAGRTIENTGHTKKD